jgi:hypothetical protein
MVVWKDVPVPIIHKCWHVHSIGGKLHRDFTEDVGDVPVWRYNEVTKMDELVVNTRGNAYAARKRLMYRRKKSQLLLDI